MTTHAYILAATRTPIGSFGGSLAHIPATKLGAAVIESLFQQTNIDKELVDEVLMGMVLQANAGQAPARQAALFASLPQKTPCTTINKVCASGLKATMLAAQSIISGDNHFVISGGMENMSSVPHYLPAMRNGLKLGDGKIIDGLVKDGLTDVYNNAHMGIAAELCAKECNISREDQDEFAISSYKRSAEAWSKGYFNDQVTPITYTQKGASVTIEEDEEFKNVKFEKIPSLKPVFQSDGTVTAANASTLNDGAAALFIASESFVKYSGIKPLAKIISYADAALAPEQFTIAPVTAIEKALTKANLSINDIDYFEINEAFSVVSLANIQKLGIDASKVNIWGGAVSLGHPLGCSGARILVTLSYILKHMKGKYGVAGICNGGGGASAMVIERIE